MSRVCQICEKSYVKGNQVPRGIGRRVTKRSIIKQRANLRYKKIDVEGQNIRVRLCSSCLKRIGFESKKLLAEQAAEPIKA